MGVLSGYKTYNPEEEGYGNAKEWRKSFSERMDPDKATEIIGDNDPYSILELKHDASINEIKTQFRKLAMKHHPDKGGDHETMQKIIAAYTILMN